MSDKGYTVIMADDSLEQIALSLSSIGFVVAHREHRWGMDTTYIKDVIVVEIPESKDPSRKAGS